MVRLLLVLLALWSFAGIAGAADAAAPAGDVDSYVAKFNPDTFKLNADGTPVYPMKNAFSTPASDIASDVADNNWFNLFVYLPFLIAPQVLLLIVIFRFRDRGDGRKPATFMTNHKLEALWTVIPILALIIVSVPVAKVLYKMELPPEQVDTNDPKQATILKITGHQFWWEYEYKAEGIDIGHDAASNQEPLVIVKDRVAVLNITSGDVNHAWWVPAFGVKKDAIRGRYTNTWFTPRELGVFKGNCAELCGEGHGVMFISSVVVTPDEFEVWKSLQRHRADTDKVWMQLQPGGGAVADEAKLKTAIDKYFEKDRSDARRFALRYWVAANYQALHRSLNFPGMADDLKAHESERRAKIETLVSTIGTDAAPVAREQ
jgi:cytochrome c oxidase subunit 2